MYEKKDKKLHKVTLFLFFLVILFGFFVLFIGKASIYEPATRDVSLLVKLSTIYKMGGIYDRSGKLIVKGGMGEDQWLVEEDEKNAFAPLLGGSYVQTSASRLTLRGSIPEIYGYGDDNRFSFKYFLRPGIEREGSSVTTTIDLALQTEVYRLVDETGYEGGAVVMNYKTGEVLAAVTTEEESTISPVFAKTYNLGSVIKPILAACAMQIDPEAVNYTYECTSENHLFSTEVGTYRINCAGDASHGMVNMEKAMTKSCNGYFISIVKQLPKTEVAQALNRFGFDSEVCWEQFQHADNVFVGAEENWQNENSLYASIGQADCKGSLVGVAAAYSVILNQGVSVEPKLYIDEEKGLRLSGNENEYDSITVIDAEITDHVVDMMGSVVSDGTLKGLGLSDYGFVGKTGTAEFLSEGELRNTIWTAGGFTTEEMPLCIVVMLHDVPTSVSSKDAGVLVKKIADYLLEEVEEL